MRDRQIFTQGLWAVNQATNCLQSSDQFDFIDYANVRLCSQYDYLKRLWFEENKAKKASLRKGKL